MDVIADPDPASDTALTMDMTGTMSDTTPTMDVIADPDPASDTALTMDTATWTMSDTAPTMDVVADPNSYIAPVQYIVEKPISNIASTMNMVTGTISDTILTRKKIILSTTSTMNMITGTISDTAPTMDINMGTMSSTAQVKNKVTTPVSYVTTTPNPSSSNQPICHAIRNDGSMFTVSDLKCLSLTPKFRQSKFCPSNMRIFTDGPTRLKINDNSYNISDIVSNNCYNYPNSNSCKRGNTDSYCGISRCVVSWAHDINVQINGETVRMIAHSPIGGTNYWTVTSNIFDGITIKSQYKALTDCISHSCINCFASPFTCKPNEECKYA
ncbi:2888_t:CDS:1 [Cetraspora pellucida]|uniref:2888_t:CDS:1 n=1 Tax=Cetraspora pellucida TaxID=1433469 RepID=A0A9N9K538_9GLOM|nr:2888_t:CDS:1 [Cetraspora pellucida]